MKTLALVSTFSRMKKYAPAIEAAIDRCWPEHPAICFISDCELPDVRKQICFPNACWTEITLRGLLATRKEHPGIKHVFYALDDHCPLRPCDTAAISTYLEIAQSHGLDVIWFPTFHWPWESGVIEYPRSLRVEVDVIDGRRLAIVPREFFRYFAMQPAFWRLDYLVDACKAALERGIRDAWAFEAMQWEGTAQHYVAEYNWPSVHHGFIAAGKINHDAISYMSGSAAAELKAQLIRDVVGINNSAVYDLYRLFCREHGIFRRVGRALLRDSARDKHHLR
jgi:hypothetical protein